MEQLSSVRAEYENLFADIHKMTELVQQMKTNVGKSLFAVFTKVQKT